MDEDLISKKELLEITDISYGQLYRWKRKSLIPEEWFIRKSVFTGQETFFPREKILDRIGKIKGMKEGVALDDLADILTPRLVKIFLSGEEIVKRNIVTKETMDFYLGLKGENGALSFDKIVRLIVLDRALRSGEINREEGKAILEVLEENDGKFGGKACELVFVRKMGVGMALLSAPGGLYFEAGVKVLFRMEIRSAIETLKLVLL